MLFENIQKETKTSLIALIIANIVALFGILFLNWSTITLLLAFWAESTIIGFFNVVKMLLSQGENKSAKIFLIPFFIFHYGIFMLVHLIFLAALFLKDELTPDLLIKSIMVAAPLFISLFISHGISLVVNYVGKKEYLKKDPGELMFSPYRRIIAMHLAILLGAFLSAAISSFVSTDNGLILGKTMAILLLIFKITFDVRAHLKEHKPTSSSLRLPYE